MAAVWRPLRPMKPDAVAASNCVAIAAEVESEDVGREPVELGGPTFDGALAAADRFGGARRPTRVEHADQLVPGGEGGVRLPPPGC